MSAAHLHPHLNSRSQPIDNRHQAIESEPAKFRVANAGKISCRNPRTVVRGADTQTLPIQLLDNFRSEDGFELLNVRVLMPEIPKHVSTTAYYIQSFALHQKISFNFFSLSLIKSMS